MNTHLVGEGSGRESLWKDEAKKNLTYSHIRAKIGPDDVTQLVVLGGKPHTHTHTQLTSNTDAEGNFSPRVFFSSISVDNAVVNALSVGSSATLQRSTHGSTRRKGSL